MVRDVVGDPVVDPIEHAVRATLRGDAEDARRAIESIPRPTAYNETCQPARARTVRTGSPSPGYGRVEVLPALQVEVFRDDQFTCRFCGKRTIFLGVLRFLSALYPDVMPRHSNWMREKTHPIYWTHSTSIDHLIPLGRGGSPGRENLVTACYICNDNKSDRLMDEIGWKLLAPSTVPWDGLTGLYSQLHEAAATPRDSWHSQWSSARR